MAAAKRSKKNLPSSTMGGAAKKFTRSKASIATVKSTPSGKAAKMGKKAC